MKVPAFKIQFLVMILIVACLSYLLREHMHIYAADRGNLTNCGTQWCWENGEATIPQLVMVPEVNYFTSDARVQATVDEFVGPNSKHGFTGVHIEVKCRWFDINNSTCGNDNQTIDDDVTIDPATFDALTRLIKGVYDAGGHTHIWMWGDNSRKQNPTVLDRDAGLGGLAEIRVEDELVSRLKDLPGWTVGYGYDLDEWVGESTLQIWHDRLNSKLGGTHLLGGRPEGPNGPNGEFPETDHSKYRSWNDGLGYASYEHHQPTYEVYRAAVQNISNKPVFSEDRFRIITNSTRPYADYNLDMTRRGLYNSTMAGGVANIWGNLSNSPGYYSVRYPNVDQIKTYSIFFFDNKRFITGMNVCPSNVTSSNTYCIKNGNKYVLYTNSARSSIATSGIPSGLEVIAVDTLQAYSERRLTNTSGSTISLPYSSEWAIAIGFGTSSNPTPTVATPPTATPTHTPTSTPDPNAPVSIISPATYQIGNLTNGQLFYIDRDFTYSSIPSYLINQSYIRTANNDKQQAGDNFLRFTVKAPSRVYVGMDPRVSPLPAWLSSFTQITDTISYDTSSNPFALYIKDVPAGEVILGGNSGQSANTSMYVVAVVPAAVATKPGDTDGDGDVDIFDYSTVLSNFGKTVSGRDNGDLDTDGDVDIFDYNAVISNFGK